MLGKILGGRYRIVRHLGGGGFGQTFLAEDLHLPGNPQCVVKQLKPRMTNPEALQTARRLFDSEAQALYALGNHDQIPRLFAHFEENQDFYLVQELVEGEVLSQELKARRQFPEIEVINLLQEILTVLEFVHQQQVVHRDIKPSNLMRRKSDRRIILIDFGAVKQIGMEAYESPDQASVTVAVGSSGYMPNEQLAGKPRFSSDVYAVGMLAIQCLTGVYPRKLKEDPKTSEIIWRDRVQVSSEFADILDMMVRYDFRQRYPSGAEALAALKSLTSTTSAVSLLAEPKLVSFDGHLAWLERGNELFQLQRYKEAVSAYDRVIQAKSNDYLAWFKRGIALENLNHYEEAVASYDQVLQLQPEDYLAWLKRGVALENLRRYPEALQSYEQVLRLQPENYWVWHDQGKVLEALQRYDEAISSYDRAVQLKPDFQLAVESRKRVLSQLKRVDTLYHLQHYDEAVASCDRAIQENPNDSLAWLMRGMALENLNCYEDAVGAYDRVVEIQPDDHVAWFKRGNVLEKLQSYEDAIASYYRVVQIQPDNYWAWNDRGRLLENLQRYEEAISSYDRAVQLQPDFQAAVEGRRRMLSQLQPKLVQPPAEEDETVISGGISKEPTANFVAQNLHIVLDGYKRRFQGQAAGIESLEEQEEETVISRPRIAERAVVNHTCSDLEEQEETMISLPFKKHRQQLVTSQSSDGPSDLETYREWLRKGSSLEKQRHYLEALDAYDQASLIWSKDATLWLYRGKVLNALERHEAAISSYARALRLQPKNVDILCGMGGSLARLKRFKDAVACFDQAIQLKPDSHNSWYWRARVLCELKQYQEAVQAFDRAIEIRPDFRTAIQERERVQEYLKALLPQVP
jgi:tetratricopeptide (TPR) repeat protein/tRNA A-37 threonylcarbamoyl transferase component Bud32